MCAKPKAIKVTTQQEFGKYLFKIIWNSVTITLKKINFLKYYKKIIPIFKEVSSWFGRASV